MKITNRMTAEGEAASQRYELILEAWRSLYHQALSSTTFGTAKQLREITESAYQIAHRYLETEMDLVQLRSEEIAREARTATLLSLGSNDARTIEEAVSEHLSASGDYLNREISVQIERDIANLRNMLRTATLQVQISARAQAKTAQLALLQFRSSVSPSLQFYFHDRADRRWPSRKFIRAVWRQHLLGVYNEVVLLTLAEHGLEFAEVVNDNPTAHSHGMRIAILPSADDPTYGEIRGEVFHPNANAVLTMASAA